MLLISTMTPSWSCYVPTIAAALVPSKITFSYVFWQRRKQPAWRMQRLWKDGRQVNRWGEFCWRMCMRITNLRVIWLWQEDWWVNGLGEFCCWRKHMINNKLTSNLSPICTSVWCCCAMRSFGTCASHEKCQFCHCGSEKTSHHNLPSQNSFACAENHPRCDFHVSCDGFFGCSHWFSRRTFAVKCDSRCCLVRWRWVLPLN